MENAVLLDARLVYEWQFRPGCWTTRARLVAREFRGGEASAEETFAPTSPLSVAKVLLVFALLRSLLIGVFDISFVFLQCSGESLPMWKCRAGSRNGGCPMTQTFIVGFCANAYLDNGTRLFDGMSSSERFVKPVTS